MINRFLRLFTAGLAVSLVLGCNQGGDTSLDLGKDDSSPQGLRLERAYVDGSPWAQVASGEFVFAGRAYKFHDSTVDVSFTLGATGNVLKEADGSLDIGAYGYQSEGDGSYGTLDPSRKLILKGGDRMPILEGAPYKIEGDSVYVDWSKGHSRYFGVSGCDSNAEVFTIKNGGLILESSSQPDLVLTLAPEDFDDGGTRRAR